MDILSFLVGAVFFLVKILHSLKMKIILKSLKFGSFPGSNGKLFATGFNGYGQLMTTDIGNRPTPTLVALALSAASVTAIAAGLYGLPPFGKKPYSEFQLFIPRDCGTYLDYRRRLLVFFVVHMLSATVWQVFGPLLRNFRKERSPLQRIKHSTLQLCKEKNNDIFEKHSFSSEVILRHED